MHKKREQALINTMQYAQLGNIIFLPVGGFGSFEKEESSVYATHELLNSKAILQPTGEELDTVSISLHLHIEFADIEQSLQDLRDYRKNFTAVDLIWGNGEKEGTYVVQKSVERINKQLPDGTRLDVTVTLDLKEYFVKDALAKQQLEARKAAPAVGDKKSTKIKTAKNPGTCPQKVTDSVQKISNYANQTHIRVIEDFWIENGLYSITAFNANYNRSILQIREYLYGIKYQCDFLKTILDTPGSCLYGNVPFYDSRNALAEAVRGFTDVLNNDSFKNKVYTNTSANQIKISNYFMTVKSADADLQIKIDALKISALPIIKIAVTRNG